MDTIWSLSIYLCFYWYWLTFRYRFPCFTEDESKDVFRVKKSSQSRKLIKEKKQKQKVKKAEKRYRSTKGRETKAFNGYFLVLRA